MDGFKSVNRCRYIFHRRTSGTFFRFLTVVVNARGHGSGADIQEQDTLVGVLRVELGRRGVHGGLADGVGRREGGLELPDERQVGHAGGDGDDLLGAALEDEREVDVEEVHVADDVDLEAFQEVFLQLLGIPLAAANLYTVRGMVRAVHAVREGR